MQVQVDANYFARVASPTPLTSQPKKPRTVAAPMQQALLPQDLATPQQLKATADGKASQPTNLAVYRPIDETPVPGSKRPAGTDGTSTSLQAPKPEQPPHKRQKTQPNIFIPKKRT